MNILKAVYVLCDNVKDNTVCIYHIVKDYITLCIEVRSVWIGPLIIVRNQNIIFLFLNQNISCGYLKNRILC